MRDAEREQSALRAEALRSQARTSVRRQSAALDVLDGVVSAPTPEAAFQRAQDAVTVMSDEEVRDAAAVLGFWAVWESPLAPVPRTADEMRARLGLVRRWAVLRRLEAWWRAS